MTPSELLARVTVVTSALVVLLAGPAAWLGGVPAAVGVTAGGALAVLNFRWLAARAAVAATAGGAPGGAWLAMTGLRLATCGAACAVAFTTGAAHPVALVVGFSLLPCALIASTLRAAREEG